MRAVLAALLLSGSALAQMRPVGAHKIDGSDLWNLPHAATLPSTCAVGDIYADSDAPSGARIYLCESANTWVAQGGVGTVTTTSTLVSGRVALSSGAASLTDDAGLTRTGTGTGFKLGIGTDVFLSRAAGLLLVEDGSGNARDVQARTGTFGTSLVAPKFVSGPGKSGTNVAGTNNTIQAEPGTGNATGSSIIFQTPTATTSGTGAQTQTTRLTVSELYSQFDNRIYGTQDLLLYKRNGVAITDSTTAVTGHNTMLAGYNDTADGAFGGRAFVFTNAAGTSLSGAMTGAAGVTALTESSATGFATLTYAASEAISAEFLVRIKANDVTDFQSLTSRVRVSSIRKATGNTISTVGVIGTDLLAESAGGSTLSCTYTVTEGAGAVTVLANCVSSLTQTTLNASFVAETVGNVRVDQL